MKFRDLFEDEGAQPGGDPNGAAGSTVKSGDIALFGERIGAKKGKKTPVLKKPLVNWKKSRIEVE